MNCKLLAGMPLCAALLSGCQSAPTLTVPSGKWVEVNQPAAPPAVVTPYQAPPAAPSRVPVMISTEVTSASPWGTPPAPIVSPAPAKTAATSAPAVVPVATATLPYKPAGTSSAAAPKNFATQPVPPLVVTKVAAPKAIAPTPTPKPIPKPVWEARTGESLRVVINNWSKRANYTVAWEAEDLDYPIDAPLRFEGSYEEAVASIFDLYKSAQRSFIVDGHREQHRLNVTEKHAKDKTRAPI